MATESLVIAALIFVSFAAGFIDSISGGGGLLLIPSLLLSGMPPQIALGTNKFAATLGTGVSLWNYWLNHMVVLEIAIIGFSFSLGFSFLGSKSVLLLNPSVVGKIIVCLLPVAMLLIFYRRENASDNADLTKFQKYFIVPLLCSILGFYDGFFGPGTGSLYIMAFYFLLNINYIKSSGTAKLFNFISNFGALLIFSINQKVNYSVAIPLAASNMLGNYVGSRVALKNKNAIRVFLIGSLVILMCSLAKKYFF